MILVGIIILIALVIFGSLTVAAVSISAHRTKFWSKCPECHWYHSGNEFERELPKRHAGFVFTARCTCCAAMERIDHIKKFARQVL